MVTADPSPQRCESWLARGPCRTTGLTGVDTTRLEGQSKSDGEIDPSGVVDPPRIEARLFEAAQSPRPIARAYDDRPHVQRHQGGLDVARFALPTPFGLIH